MQAALISPADAAVFNIPTVAFSILIPVTGVALFVYILSRRIAPLLVAQPDYRCNHFSKRLVAVLKYWFGQWKQPRYPIAGIIHILIFGGFLILAIRSTSLVVIGIDKSFVFPGMEGSLGHLYSTIKDYVATIILLAALAAAYIRIVVKPGRFQVPVKYGKDHTGEAVFVLALITALMLSESIFDASNVAAHLQQGFKTEAIAPFTLTWLFYNIFTSVSLQGLQSIHLISYYSHDVIFFSFLCFLPMGKHFHVITSFFNVYFMKLAKGGVKPVKWGVGDDKLDELGSFGVKKFEDFTWKHILDFYSCADCGRCSDQCPANAVGRPLSPRFIGIKAREYGFSHYPLQGSRPESEPLMGAIYEEDEIWSCTTCGACEEECPIMIEYIDKIVDLRRGLVDDGNVPQSLQKPLSALAKRGNPWGKMEKKRADWVTPESSLTPTAKIKILDDGETADTLFFVDSISSYDDRIIRITQAVSRLLGKAGIDFGILGKLEKDSGHDVRRFGEEMLFQTLKESNVEAILASGARRIVTADPHTYNAFMKDYRDLPPVFHISELLADLIRSGKINLNRPAEAHKLYTYHDPCYLGRHNTLYDIPRTVLDSVPGLHRIEMEKCRDRSFCCGGGGLMLFYEPVEEERMGRLRVEMAKSAGANVIVTACPFCMVNIEDAIKTSGLEGEMEVIDLVELIENHLN